MQIFFSKKIKKFGTERVSVCACSTKICKDIKVSPHSDDRIGHPVIVSKKKGGV